MEARETGTSSFSTRCGKAAESESAGRDGCSRMCGRWDARQEIGVHRGVAAEPGGTGNTFGSADLQPAPRALTWIELAHVNGHMDFTWPERSRDGLGSEQANTNP